MMEALIIQPTTHLPKVEFNQTGELLLEGRSIPEDANKLFDPLIDFVKSLNTESIIFNVSLEYFNTASSKKILQLFKALDKNENIYNISIHWHYEYGDDDSVETAEIYESCLKRSNFTFHEHAEIEFALAS